MRFLLPLFAVFVTLAAAVAEDAADAPAAAETATLTRRLVDFPAGKYVMVQTFDESARYTLEAPDQEKQEQKTRLWNRFTFDLEIADVVDGEAKRREARVVVRRVEIGIEGEKNLAYDSDGAPDEQSEILRRQFHPLVGGKAVVDLAAFGGGGGFEGLSAVWDRFGKENPDLADAAAANRKNYGDSRLDRMFARGLPVLFGSEAGRAAGRTRKLTTGETFEVGLEIVGIGRETATSTHTVEVESLKDGHVRLVVTWAENGHNPKIDGTRILMRGGDIQGRSEMTFHLASGLLVGLEETEKRIDQTCGMDMVQRTRYATTVSGFSIAAK